MFYFAKYLGFKDSASPEGDVTDLSRLEIRVGKVVEVGKHPEADGLYVEKVDCGEASGPRTIVSGLVQYCTLEQMQDRMVVILANLKPRALKGIESHGMVLCASTGEEAARKVEPISPPAGAAPGELITFMGHKSQPEAPGNRATKAYSKIADDFYVDDNGQATYKGIPFMTPQGSCTASFKGKIS